MIEFTQHEQQQIRDGVKTSHRVLCDPQPERNENFDGDDSFWMYDCTLFWTDEEMKEELFHNVLGGENPPVLPGDRIPADGGEIVVGDVRVQQLKEMSEEDAMSEGVKICPPYVGIDSGGMPIESELIHWAPTDYFVELWNSRCPEHPFNGELWVFVYEGLRWEASE